MLINDIKVQDEKIVIITENQILKALGLSKKRYALSDVDTIYSDYAGDAKIIIKVRSNDTLNKSIKMNIVECKTLDNFIEE